MVNADWYMLRYYMSKMMRVIIQAKVSFWKYLYESCKEMYLLDMGNESFLYLCIMDLLHVLHALIRSFVDKITLIILDLRHTTLS